MPIVQNVTVVSAAAPVANAMTGSMYQRPTFKARVRYYMTGDAAGAIRVAILHGMRTVMESSPISRANIQPLIPDHFLCEAIIMPLEEIVVRVIDTAAGPDNLFWRAEITPVR